MPTPEEIAAARQKRADDTLWAIAGGADPGAEALKLSNEFTDEWLTRVEGRIRRFLRRRPRG